MIFKYFGIHSMSIIQNKFISINSLMEEIDNFKITEKYVSQKFIDLHGKHMFPILTFTLDTEPAEFQYARLLITIKIGI
jgi:hypothetical protein